jgi:transposase-like protein
MKVLTLVDRDTGRAKSIVVDDLKIKTLLPILKENIAAEATVYTDEAMQYDHLNKHFAVHQSVNHGKEEYVRGDG